MTPKQLINLICDLYHSSYIERVLNVGYMQQTSAFCKAGSITFGLFSN